MPLRYLTRLPRQYWLPLGLLAIVASHLPLFLLGAHHPSVLVLPIVMTSVALMITQKHGRWVVWLAVCSALVAGLPHLISAGRYVKANAGGVPPEVLTPDFLATQAYFSPFAYQLQNVAALMLAHFLVGLSHFIFVKSPFSPQQTQSRMAGRLRRQAEELEAARESEKTAIAEAKTRTALDRKRLLEHLPVHLVLKDRNGRFTFVSQSFCTLVQRNFDDIIGKTDFDLFPEAEAQKFVDDDKVVMNTGEVFNDVEETKLPDGTSSFVQVRKAAIREADGQIIGVQGIFWDVTEEYTRRKELQRIESRAHALINAALDAVLIVDAEGHVLDANPASEAILGYTQDQVAMHPPIGEIMQTGTVQTGQRRGDSQGAFRRKTAINEVLRQCTGKRIEVKLRRRDAAWFDAEISAHPLTIDDTQGWAIFIRDISGRKQFEKELRDARDLAEQANAMKTEFVANVSHELRTPLTGIMGLQELLAASNLDRRQKNYLELSKVSASNLLTLIDDLLDFSKIESGHIEIDPGEYDCLETMQLAAISMAARAQLKGLELLVDIPAGQVDGVDSIGPYDTGVIRTIGDAHRVRQIILNLVGNAIKFTSAGHVRIKLRLLEPSGEPGAAATTRMRIEVHDSGIGVSPEQRQVIFEAFRQADASTTRKFGGTGLGLTICRDIVAQMEGAIGVTTALTIDGEPCKGSCFFFEIPTEVISSGPRYDDFAPQRNEQVVLAMRPSQLRTLMHRELELLGYQVTALSTDQMTQRASDPLFAAGNHTIVVADSREIACWNEARPPVVIRWVLLHQLANMQPQELPSGLRHAEVNWLPHPFLREQLLEALQAEENKSSTEESEEESASGGALAAKRSARVLLVEDSPINQTVLSDMLKSLGHKVSTASTGQEAIDACEQSHFDLVLMDIQMPVVDGLEATRRIRQREVGLGRRQLICALTAHAASQDRQRCQDAGMDMFLEKPVVIDLLEEAVNCALTGQIPEACFLSHERALLATGPEASHSTISSTSETAPPHEGRSVPRPTPKTEQHVGQPVPSPIPESEQHVGRSVPRPTTDTDQPSTASPIKLDRERAFADSPSWPELVSLLHGNESLTADVLRLLQSEIPKLGREFGKQLSAGDAKQTRRAIHTFKSNVRQVGLKSAANYAATLEDMARDGRLDELADHVDTVSALSTWVAQWAAQLQARQ